jgi:hypothetical protein
VVDDGSGEQSMGVLLALAGIPGVRVLHHAMPCGKGAALKTAFRTLLTDYPLVECVVMAAADGRYRAEDIGMLAAVANRVPPVLVLGVRRGVAGLGVACRVRKWVLDTGFWLRTGCWLHDAQTGLRVLPRDLLLEALTLSSNGCEFDTALLRRGVAWGGEIVEIAIDSQYTEFGDGPRPRPWRDFWRILGALIGRMERQ